MPIPTHISCIPIIGIYRRRTNLDPAAEDGFFSAVQQTRHKTRFLSTLRNRRLNIYNIYICAHNILRYTAALLSLRRMRLRPWMCVFPFPAIRHECVFRAFHTTLGQQVSLNRPVRLHHRYRSYYIVICWVSLINDYT